MKTTAAVIRDHILAGALGKSGDEVTIACEDGDAANDLFEALMRLMDEETAREAAAAEKAAADAKANKAWDEYRDTMAVARRT